MGDSGLVLAGQIIVSLFGLIGGAFGAWSLYRQVVKKTEAETKISDNTKAIEAIKSTAIEKAQTVKAETEAETKRLDAILDLVVKQIENLQEENKDQRKEMNDIRAGGDITRARLDTCLEDKATLQAQIRDLEISRREDKVMLRNLQANHEKLQKQLSNGRPKGKVKIENATIEGEKK